MYQGSDFINQKRSRSDDEDIDVDEAQCLKRMTLNDPEHGATSSTSCNNTITTNCRRRKSEECLSLIEHDRKHSKIEALCSTPMLTDLETSTGEEPRDTATCALSSDIPIAYYYSNGRVKYARRVDYAVDRLIRNTALRRRTEEVSPVSTSHVSRSCYNNGLPSYYPRGSHPLQDRPLFQYHRLVGDNDIVSECEIAEASSSDDEGREVVMVLSRDPDSCKPPMHAYEVTHTEWGMEELPPGVERIEELPNDCCDFRSPEGVMGIVEYPSTVQMEM